MIIVLGALMLVIFVGANNYFLGKRSVFPEASPTSNATMNSPTPFASPQTQRSPQVTSQKKIDPEIREALKNKLKVPAIVSLRRREGVMDEVLTTLAPGEFNLTYRWDNLFQFAGAITANGLNKLENNSDVESVLLDKPVSYY